MSTRTRKAKPAGLLTFAEMSRMRSRALARGSEFIHVPADENGRLVGVVYVESRNTTLLGYLDDEAGVEQALAKYFSADCAQVVRRHLAAWRAQQTGVTGRA